MRRHERRTFTSTSQPYCAPGRNRLSNRRRACDRRSCSFAGLGRRVSRRRPRSPSASSASARRSDHRLLRRDRSAPPGLPADGDRPHQARAGPVAADPRAGRRDPGIAECHRITGEDCFDPNHGLRSSTSSAGLLDRFLVYGETTTSLINASPIPRRDPPLTPRHKREGAGKPAPSVLVRLGGPRGLASFFTLPLSPNAWNSAARTNDRALPAGTFESQSVVARVSASCSPWNPGCRCTGSSWRRGAGAWRSRPGCRTSAGAAAARSAAAERRGRRRHCSCTPSCSRRRWSSPPTCCCTTRSRTGAAR